MSNIKVAWEAFCIVQNVEQNKVANQTDSLPPGSFLIVYLPVMKRGLLKNPTSGIEVQWEHHRTQ